MGKQVQNAWIYPTGKRVLFEARGEIFSVPAEHGVIRNLTQTSGAAERSPAWSPDGRKVAYWSDRSGEYELVVRNVDGSDRERILTSLGSGFRYQPYWSPDSQKIVFIDEDLLLLLLDVETAEVGGIDRGDWAFASDTGFPFTRHKSRKHGWILSIRSTSAER